MSTRTTAFILLLLTAPGGARAQALPAGFEAQVRLVSRATVPMYPADELRFEAVKTAQGKGVRIYHGDAALATLEVGGFWTGWQVADRLIAILEARRQDAAARSKLVSLDRRLIAEYNETGFWSGRLELEKPEVFGRILRIHERLVAEDL